MVTKRMSRKQIAESLRPRKGQTRQELITLTLDGLEAALKGIEAGEIPDGHTIPIAASALGYLLGGCTEQAARAARQVAVPVHLAPASRNATPAELLAGVATLRKLRLEKG